jgi:hypothetical protein
MSLISSIISPEYRIQQWMIADERGNSVLPIKSILSLSATSGGSVVSDAIEEGSFTAYNKTSEPLELNMEIGFEGEDWELNHALTSLTELKESVATFSIVTPYHEYENMTLENYDYEMKTENGLGALIANCTFKEIREVKPAYSQVDASTIQQNQDENRAAQSESISSDDCSDASDSSVEDGGQVSPSTPTGDEGTAAEEDNRSMAKTGLDAGKEILGGLLS